jgi:hypothetical protein
MIFYQKPIKMGVNEMLCYVLHVSEVENEFQNETRPTLAILVK